MAQQEKMNLLEFMERFGTEDACREHLYKIKWPEGFVCPKCGVKHEPYIIKARNKYQCKHCNHQTSVTAGTIMHRSSTPLIKWFLAIYLMGQDKRGCSAVKLQSELGIAYDTAWTISHKIRKAMKDRDCEYMLSGTVEVDEAFFGATRAGSKRGRGTDKTAVVFGLSMDEQGHPGYLRARACETINGETLASFAEDNIEAGATIRSDGLPAYNELARKGYKLEAKPFNPKDDCEHLKWIHVIISNAKAFVNGTYHGLGSKHLQAFLDEFCFRFSRRFWSEQIFFRTLNACINSSPYSRYALIG